VVMSSREEHTPPSDSSRDLCVGEWKLRPAEGLLARDGKEIHLRPRAMEVLAMLATRPGRVVSKGEIFAEVWEGNAVEDGALAHCISEIRNALGDTPRDPRYIETLPKRGYRLVAPVADAPPESPESPDAKHGGRRLGALVVAGVLAGLLAWWTMAGLGREAPGRRSPCSDSPTSPERPGPAGCRPL
jgi:DNA-binding winged helix-turn-helix (wHTH) protein